MARYRMRKLFHLSAVEADNEPIREQVIMLAIDDAVKEVESREIKRASISDDMGL